MAAFGVVPLASAGIRVPAIFAASAAVAARWGISKREVQMHGECAT